MAPKWERPANPFARLIDLLRFSDRHDEPREGARVRWRPLGHHTIFLLSFLILHALALVLLVLFILLSPRYLLAGKIPLLRIWSPLSRAEIVVGALTACRRATGLSPWLCSEADYQERNAPIFAAISNAALRSTMPGSWRTEAILLTVAEAFLVLTFIFLVLSLLLEHKLRRDLLSSVPLHKLQKRQTRARHMAMRALHCAVLGGVFGIIAVFRLYFMAERSRLAFAIVARSQRLVAGALSQAEVGHGFTLLWAAFGLLASLLWFGVNLVATEADVVVEEEPAPAASVRPGQARAWLT